VRCGAAWWFNDHRRGIEEQINVLAETGCLNSFLGMLTDSRSFLSYVRHDYFRRILCDVLGRWVQAGECSETAARAVGESVSYGNIARLIYGKSGDSHENDF
jgi:glucuronate isomerase